MHTLLVLDTLQAATSSDELRLWAGAFWTEDRPRGVPAISGRKDGAFIEYVVRLLERKEAAGDVLCTSSQKHLLRGELSLKLGLAAEGYPRPTLVLLPRSRDIADGCG